MTVSIVISGAERRFYAKSIKYVNGILRAEGFVDVDTFQKLSLGQDVELKLLGQHLGNFYLAFKDKVSKKIVLWAHAKRLGGLLYTVEGDSFPELKFKKEGNADTIVGDILSGTGFSIGSCPSDSISVEFDNDTKLSALKKVAEQLNASFYFDDDKLYILREGNDKGSVSGYITKIEHDVEEIRNKIHAYSFMPYWRRIGNVYLEWMKPVHVVAEDAESISQWGERQFIYKRPLVSSVEELQNIADAILQEYKDPAINCELLVSHHEYLSKGLKPLDKVSFTFEGEAYTLTIRGIEIRDKNVKLVAGSVKPSIEDIIQNVLKRQSETPHTSDGIGRPRMPGLTPDGLINTQLATAQLTRTYFRQTGLLIPMYIYPWDSETGSWKLEFENLLKLMKQYWKVPVYIVINPSSGPGTVEDGVWRRAIKKIHGAGGTVLGYVSTDYTNRSLSDVKADIDKWLELYPHIDGLFVDEMTNDDDQSHRDYYRNLTVYAHQKGLYPVVGNPGAPQLSSYFLENCADIFVVWETDSYPSESDLEQGDWEDSYREIPWQTRGALVYGQSELDAENFMMMTKHVGLVYVTSGTSPNPWSEFPPYLETMFALLTAEAYGLVEFYGGVLAGNLPTNRQEEVYKSYSEEASDEGYWEPQVPGRHIIILHAEAHANADGVTDADIKNSQAAMNQIPEDRYIKKLRWATGFGGTGSYAALYAILDDDSEQWIVSASAETPAPDSGACIVKCKWLEG